MPTYIPGQFKQALQNKVKAIQNPDDDDQPFAIKKTAPSQFTPRASDYYRPANDQQTMPHTTTTLPKDSPLNKSVHERMKAFVKEQYGGK